MTSFNHGVIMKHIQTKVTESEYKEIKKKVIDLSTTMEEFIRNCILTKLKDEELNEAK